MEHVMFDLETWGTRPGCALRSIGAVVFDPETDAIGAEFYANIGKSQPPTLHVDSANVDWWRRQSAEAQAAFTAPEQVSLRDAVAEFHAWFRLYRGQYIWCHGATFDEPVWRVAAHAVSATVPWRYQNVRDTRTLYDIARIDKAALTFGGTKHNALDDARFQARCVQAAMAALHQRRAA